MGRGKRKNRAGTDAYRGMGGFHLLISAMGEIVPLDASLQHASLAEYEKYDFRPRLPVPLHFAQRRRRRP